MTDTATRFRPRRYLLRTLALVLVVLAAVFAKLWFWTAPNLPTEPVVLVRGDDGDFHPRPGNEPGSDGFAFAVHAGSLNSDDTATTSHSTTGSSHARFACRHVALHVASDHLLVRRVGNGLLERLKRLDCLARIDYFPGALSPAEGDLAPDLWISLELETITESAGLLSRDLEATLVLTAGNRRFAPYEHYTDTSSPPVIDLNLDCRLEHCSTMSGIESSGARYQMVAENISERLADSFTEVVDKLRGEHGLLPRLPDPFTPPYEGPPSLRLPDGVRAEQLSSLRGLMCRTDTVWRLTSARPAMEVVQELHQALASRGWSGDLETGEQEPHVRMIDGAKVINVFPWPHSRGRRTSTAARADQPVLLVEYLDRLSAEETRSAVDATIAANAPNAVLMLFQNQWSAEQARQALAVLEGRDVRTAETWLLLARCHERLEQDDRAREALRRCIIMLRTVIEPDELKSAAEQLAKSLGDEKLDDEEPSREQLLELGFVELTADEPIPDREIAMDQPAMYFAQHEGGVPQIFTLSVMREGEGRFKMVHLEVRGGMRSWGSGPVAFSTSIEGQFGVVFSGRQLDDGERTRFLLTAERCNSPR